MALLNLFKRLYRCLLGIGQPTPSKLEVACLAGDKPVLKRFMKECGWVLASPSSFDWVGVCDVPVPTELWSYTGDIERHYRHVGWRVERRVHFGQDGQLIRTLVFYRN